MKSFRYLAWDGTQLPFSLKRKEVMDAFMENIMKGMTPNMSLAQMIWDGFPMAGMNFRVMGLEEMLKEIQQQKRDLFSKYNLDKAFDKPIDELKRLLAEEAMTRQEKGAEPSPHYEDLPAGLLEKIKNLENFPFMNQFSQEAYDSWKERRDEILELYEFYAEYSHKFQGDESLDFDQAMELMRQLKSLESLQQQLLNGEFQSIDPRAIRDMLGEEASRSFTILLQLPDMITEEG
ncbi:MAG: hypothetical protein JRI34_12415, partial [Deltaproteobacteria bacterium]|nr:hypothetical protein [Deltaproteobacteria bacterium]